MHRWSAAFVVVLLAGCLGGGNKDELPFGCGEIEVVPPHGDIPHQSGEYFPLAPGDSFEVKARGLCGKDPDVVTWHVLAAGGSAGWPPRNETIVGTTHHLSLDPIGMYRVTGTPVFGSITGEDESMNVGITPVVGLYETRDVGLQGISIEFQAFCCPGMTGIRLVDRPPLLTWTVTLTTDDGVEVWRTVIGGTGLAGIGSEPYRVALGESFLESFTLAVTPDAPVPPTSAPRIEVCIGNSVSGGGSAAIALCSF